MDLKLVLLWVSQVACVWGLTEGARLSAWFCPCLLGTMCLSLGDKKSVEFASHAVAIFNVVMSFVFYTQEDFWRLVHPAMVALPLLLAADI